MLVGRSESVSAARTWLATLPPHEHAARHARGGDQAARQHDALPAHADDQAVEGAHGYFLPHFAPLLKASRSAGTMPARGVEMAPNAHDRTHRSHP